MTKSYYISRSYKAIILFRNGFCETFLYFSYCKTGFSHTLHPSIGIVKRYSYFLENIQKIKHQLSYFCRCF